MSGKHTPCPHCGRMFESHRTVCNHIDKRHGKRAGREYYNNFLRGGERRGGKWRTTEWAAAADEKMYGKMGAASPVRKIDPKDYEGDAQNGFRKRTTGP